MEYFDLYNENGQLLNKKAQRGTKLDVGEFHIVVNIWIRNSEGNYLIQQRNKLSDKIPFMWATTAGAVIAGDSSLKTAVKETYEELGILIDEKEFMFLKRYPVNNNSASFLLDVYLVEMDVLLKDLKIDEIEVKDAKYLSMEDILKQKELNTFFDYGFYIKQKKYFELIEKS